MPSYVVDIIKMHETMGETIGNRTVVYADSELEARHTGASMLGALPDDVRVAVLTVNPTDAEMNEVQREGIAQTENIPDYMRNIHK